MVRDLDSGDGSFDLGSFSQLCFRVRLVVQRTGDCEIISFYMSVRTVNSGNMRTQFKHIFVISIRRPVPRLCV